MQESKNTVVNNIKAKRKQFGYVTPFESYLNNSLTKERNPQYYLGSSCKKTNRSLLEYIQGDTVRGRLCLKHSLSLNWVCFTCGFDVYCSQCMVENHRLKGKQDNKGVGPSNTGIAKQGSLISPITTKQPPSLQHDIRPIQKSYIFMKNSLIQCQIRLQAKCNILTNMNQQIHNQKIELYNEKNQYKEELERQFEYIHSVLRQKQEQMVLQMEKMFIEHEKRFLGMIDDIKSLQQYYDQCQHSISSILQHQSTTTEHETHLRTCLFYSQNSSTLTSILSDQQIENIKQQIYSINFKLENHDLNHILSYVHSLELGCEQKFVYRNLAHSQLNNNKEILKVKSQTHLKGVNQTNKPIKNQSIISLIKNPLTKTIHPQVRNEKSRDSHKILGTFTPKALSRQNKIELLKKSPQNNLLKKRKKSNPKIVSMPTSPAKEDKQQSSSPINKARDFIIQGMRKKTTIVKKKK